MRLVAPILAYHAVHPLRLDSISVTPENFGAHLKWLAQRGYRGVGLAEYLRQADAQPSKAGRLVALTFDDGYLDNLTYAVPLLEKFGFSATIFVVAERIGTEHLIDPDLLTRYPAVPRTAYSLLSWAEVQTLQRKGIEIGSHTCTHPKLDQLETAAQRYEICQSKKMLETHLQQLVVSFCYPYGHFNDDSLHLVQAAGYQQAVVTPWRTGLIRGGRFTLRRVGLYHSDTLLRFVVKTSPLFELFRTIRHRRQANQQP
jgi:peptidoglycan/xylan/chitin deacetylase (PgdA/CDA1 family)